VVAFCLRLIALRTLDRQSIGSPRRRCPRGKAASIRAISACDNCISDAPAFSSTCSTLDALGIAKTEGRRVRNASAIWRGVASCACAISASRRLPGVCLLGKSPCPNGLYAVTARRCCSHQGNTACSIARSCK
jgi:hypothetical protein